MRWFAEYVGFSMGGSSDTDGFSSTDVVTAQPLMINVSELTNNRFASELFLLDIFLSDNFINYFLIVASASLTQAFSVHQGQI